MTLPKGLVGRLAGIPYCSEAALAAAAASSGKAQQAKPSCSSESAIGTVTTVSGTGGAPLSLPGVAYLAGPYKGAPISMAVVTPAVSGPFDLGTVVVRVALNINPLTAQVNAVSDPIPNVFGGVKLDVRSIDVRLDRYKFTTTPTNCAAGATAGTVNGGGSNPASSASWSSARSRRPTRPPAATSLGFKPTLNAKITGGTTRAKNPKIRVVVKAQLGRRQHRPHGAQPAALAVPRSGSHQDHLHEGPAGGEANARRAPSTAMPKRARRCSSRS